MAAGNSSYTRAITTTLQDHGKEIFDAVSTNNALKFMLEKRDNIKLRRGGRSFTHPLYYKKNASFGSIAKLDTISTDIPDNLTRAEYPIKILAGSIVLSDFDISANAGDKVKLLDLAEEAKMDAQISMSELIGDQVWANGSNVNDFDGLQFLISDSPSTQTDVGGVNPSTTGNEYWRNYAYTDAIAAFNTSNAGITAMNTVVNETTFGTMGPRAIFTTKTVYALYELSQVGNIRYEVKDLADGGFRHQAFKTMPLMFDDNCPASHMYFVDVDSLWMQVLLQDGNVMAVSEGRHSLNQLVTIALMSMFANLTTGSRRTNGVITNITG